MNTPTSNALHIAWQRLIVGFALTASIGLVAVGCSDDPPAGSTGQVATNNDTTSTNNSTNNTSTSTNNATTSTNNATTSTNNGTTTAEPARLERVGDQVRNLTANSSLELDVRYIDPSGAPGANKSINWELVGEELEGANLDAFQSVTDGDGNAKVTVLGGQRQATFDVVATVDGEPDVEAVGFTVNVQSKEFANYRVRVRYEDGVRDYTNTEIKTILFQSPETCDEINPLNLVGAFRSDQRRPDVGFPPEMVFQFNNLRNDTSYTVVSVGFADGNNQVIGSYGCNDLRPVIVEGEDPEDIVVEMRDFLPEMAGTWEITSEFNLTEALPDSVLTYLNPILDFFTDPAGTLTTLLLDFIVDQFGIDIDQARGLIEGIANDLLAELLDSNDFVGDFLAGGGDISDILRNFKLQGRIVVAADDIQPNGLFTDADIIYERFGYRWRLQCTDEDFEQNPSCGDAFVDFARAGLSAAEATVDGAIVPSSDPANPYFHALAIEDHPLSLNYGEIIIYLIENLVLPLLFEDLEEYSLRGLLNRFIVCEDLFDSDFFVQICNTGIEEVSNLAVDFVTDQSLNYERFTLGTPDASPCPLFELDDDDYGAPAAGTTAHYPKFQQMGRDPDNTRPEDRRCDWEAVIQFSDDPNDATNFSGRWFSKRLFD